MGAKKRRLLIRTNKTKLLESLQAFPGKVQALHRVASLGGFLLEATPKQEVWLRRAFGPGVVFVDGIVVPVPYVRSPRRRGSTAGGTPDLPFGAEATGLVGTPEAAKARLRSDRGGAQALLRSAPTPDPNASSAAWVTINKVPSPVRSVAMFDNGIAKKELFASKLSAFSSNGLKSTSNVQDHPTQTASIILNAEIGDPQATVLSLDVATSPALLCAAVAWATANREKYNIRVFCMPIEVTGDSELIPAVDEHVAAAREAGILVCVAAGNGGPIGPPASAPKAMAVGGYDDPSVYKDNDEVPHGTHTRDSDPSTKPDIYRPWGPYTAIDATGMEQDFFGTSGACASAAAVSSRLGKLTVNADEIELRLRAAVNLTPSAVAGIVNDLSRLPP